MSEQPGGTVKHGGCFFCKSTKDRMLESGLPRDSGVYEKMKSSVAVCSDQECREKVEMIR